MISERRFLRIPFLIGSAAEISDFIAAALSAGRGMVLCHCNTHSLYVLGKDRSRPDALTKPNIVNIFEGIALKLANYAISREWWPDVSGTDLVPELLSRRFARPLRVSLVGGRRGVAARAAERMPGDWIVASVHDGYDGIRNEDLLVEQLIAAKPDLILVGLGTPLQEQKALCWSRRIPGAIFWCVGGLFDFRAGMVPRAPRLIRRVRLEWLWRVLHEPRRLLPRYGREFPWLLKRTVETMARQNERNEEAVREVDRLSPPVLARSGSEHGHVAEHTRAPIKLGPQAIRGSVGASIYGGVTEALSRALRTPQYLILFVSDQCWMKCAHCWFNEDWKDTNLTASPLSFDEYERLARSMPAIAFLSITGGEAFQRRDIVELVTMFRTTTRLGRYQIPTSGYRTGKIVRDAERMLRSNPDTPFRVDVSLDGIGAVHDEVRRIKGGFDRAVETIRALNALKVRYPHFDVGVITTISRINQHVVRETAALVEDIHPEGEWMINIARGDGRDQTAVEVDAEAYRLAHSLIDDRIARGAYRGHGGHWSAKWLSAKNAARRDIIYEIVRGERAGGGCAAGSLAGVIYSDGGVGACEMLDRPLGNLRDFDCDLVRLWQSEKAREVRSFIQRSQCQCTQECFLSMSMLISPDAWRKMLRERLKLARAPARA